MKRIVVFNDALVLAGTEMLLVDILNRLADDGHEVTLLLPHPSSDDVLLGKLAKNIGVKYLRDAQGSRLAKIVDENLMLFAPWLYRKLKGLKLNDYDVALCFKETLYARLFKGVKPRKVLWIHTMMYHRQYKTNSLVEYFVVMLNKRHITLANKAYKAFDEVVCVSNACRQSYDNIVYGNKPYSQLVQVLFNAVDVDKVKARSIEIEVYLPEKMINFVCVTRNSADKGAGRIFEVAEMLKNDGYQFHISVIGAGFDTDEIHSHIEGLGINDVVTLLGRQDNPHPYVLAADWTLCVSERESFSLSLLESMALGTPVITTNCGGPVDIVDNGRYGLLVDNSVDGVYKGMKAVLNNTSLHNKYTEELAQGLARFSYQEWIDGVYKVLKLNDK